MRPATIEEFNAIQNLMELSFPADERRTAAEHLATDPEIRGQGVGGRILTAIKALVHGQMIRDTLYHDIYKVQ